MIRAAIFKILSGWRSGVSFHRTAVHPFVRFLSTCRPIGRIRLALTFLPPVDHIRLVNIFFFHNRHHKFRTKQSVRCRRDAQSIWRRTLLLQPSNSKGRRLLHLSSAVFFSPSLGAAPFLCTFTWGLKKGYLPFLSCRCVSINSKPVPRREWNVLGERRLCPFWSHPTSWILVLSDII